MYRDYNSEILQLFRVVYNFYKHTVLDSLIYVNLLVTDCGSIELHLLRLNFLSNTVFRISLLLKMLNNFYNRRNSLLDFSPTIESNRKNGDQFPSSLAKN